jgi:hypothetical protein
VRNWILFDILRRYLSVSRLCEAVLSSFAQSFQHVVPELFCSCCEAYEYCQNTAQKVGRIGIRRYVEVTAAVSPDL